MFLLRSALTALGNNNQSVNQNAPSIKRFHGSLFIRLTATNLLPMIL